MEPYNINKTIDAYFLSFTAEKGTADYENSSWATDLVLDWEMEGDSDSLWEFILVAYKRELPNDLLAILAAGPLEDLLATFGPAYIDRVEDLARTDPKFNRLLGGVWRNSMTDDLWKRVQAAQTTPW